MTQPADDSSDLPGDAGFRSPPEPVPPPPQPGPPPAAFPPPPPAPGYYASPLSGLAMKRRNPFAAWIGLPLITLGIYQFVWYYKIHKEMAEFDRRREIPVVGPMLVLLLLGWTIIGPLISYHNAGTRIRDAQVAAGLPPTCTPLLCWLLAFAFGTNILYMQFELDKIVDRYPGAPAHTPVPLYA